MKAVLYYTLILLILGIMSAQRTPVVFEKSPFFNQNIYGEEVRPKSFPLVLDFDENFPMEKVPQVQEAVLNLNSNLGFEAILLSNRFIKTDFFNKEKDGKNTIYWGNVHNSQSLFSASEQAKTTIYWEGNLIIESDIRFNSQSDLLSCVDMDSLIRHEFSHALGLKHFDGLMNDYLGCYSAHPDLSQAVVEKLQFMYKQQKKSQFSTIERIVSEVY